MNKNIEILCEELKQAKKEEQAAGNYRKEIEKELYATLQKEGYMFRPGTNTFGEYGLKIVCTQKTTWDQEKLDHIFDSGPALWPFVSQWKPEKNNIDYIATVDPALYQALSEAREVKPQKPQFKLED